MEIDENKDYSGAGGEEAGDENFSTPEELNAYLGEAEKGAPTLEELEAAAAKDDATDEEKLAAFEAKNAQELEEEKGIKPGADEKEKVGSPDAGKEGVEEEFDNTLAYLNKEHELGLNLAEIPEEMTREQEAEAISGIIGRMVEGVNQQVAQYEDIKQLISDPEVASFIAAKAEGKTMVDFVSQYAGRPEGMGDETLAMDELKIKLPHLSDEDITAQVQSMKDRDKLEDFATKVRSERETLAIEKAEFEKNNVALQEQEKEKVRIAEVEDFNQFMTSQKDIYGIPLNTEMKKQIFGAATQPDKDGETYLEKALQSNEGVLLATAGLLHMDRLMKGYASLDVNQRKKSFMDTLFDSPDALQSASSEHKQEGFDMDAANQF